MSIGVIAYWSVHPWVTAHKSGPKRWISLYTYTLRTFGGTDFILIGRDIPHYESHDLNFRVYPNLESALRAYPTARLVALVGKTPENVHSIDLKDYKHPNEDVLYITGSDYGDIEFGKLEEFADRCDFVTIKTPEDFPLWAHVSLAIALYDRDQKWPSQ